MDFALYVSIGLIVSGIGLMASEPIKCFLYDFRIIESQAGHLIHANSVLSYRINDLSEQIQELKNETFTCIHDIAELKAYIHDLEVSKANKRIKAKVQAKAKPVKKRK
jgi:hypothetical protein